MKIPGQVSVEIDMGGDKRRGLRRIVPTKMPPRGDCGGSLMEIRSPAGSQGGLGSGSRGILPPFCGDGNGRRVAPTAILRLRRSRKVGEDFHSVFPESRVDFCAAVS
jgi:hypothetical protein